NALVGAVPGHRLRCSARERDRGGRSGRTAQRHPALDAHRDAEDRAPRGHGHARRVPLAVLAPHGQADDVLAWLCERARDLPLRIGVTIAEVPLVTEGARAGTSLRAE